MDGPAAAGVRREDDVVVAGPARERQRRARGRARVDAVQVLLALQLVMVAKSTVFPIATAEDMVIGEVVGTIVGADQAFPLALVIIVTGPAAAAAP